MEILKSIGAIVVAMGVLSGTLLGINYIFPLLKSFNLSDMMIIGIIALIPILVRIAFVSFTFYRNPASRSGGLISVIMNDLIMLSNAFLPYAIMIALVFAVAVPSIRQDVLIMIPLISIPLRLLSYRKRESEWVGIGSMIIDDIILFSISILPFIVIMALIVAMEEPEIQQEIFQFSRVSVVFIVIVLFISARRRRAQSQIYMTEEYKQWRVNLLDMKAEEAGISSDSPDTVYGVLLDWNSPDKIEYQSISEVK